MLLIPDIFWQTNNKLEIIAFLKDYNDIKHCKNSLSKQNNFFGLKKVGDFNLKNENVSNWVEEMMLFFIQVCKLYQKLYLTKHKIFPMNEIWNKMIIDKNLSGSLMQSNIMHIGIKTHMISFKPLFALK